MAFLDDVTKVMTEARNSGKRYLLMDNLAYQLGIQAEPAKRITAGGANTGKMAGEVLADKLERLAASAADLGYDFPWEIVTYRSREAGGIPEMEGVVYKTVAVKDENGVQKYTKGGKEAEQNYYWPALVWINPAKEAGKRAIGKLRDILSPNIPSDQFYIGTTPDGLTMTITFLLNQPVEEAKQEDSGSVAKPVLTSVA